MSDGTLTFKEYTEKNNALYAGTNVSELDRATIADWFNLRVVCDDDNFGTFFRRVINRDYPRYLQLMRVQPGIDGTSYDWMVQEYSAAINSVTSQVKNSGTDTVETSGSTSGTTNGTGNTSVTHDTAETHSGKDTQENSTTYGKTVTVAANTDETVTHDTTDTSVKTGGHTDTHGGSDSTSFGTGGLKDTRTITGAYADIHGGTDTETHSGTDSTVDTHHADHAQADKIAPMSNEGTPTMSAGSDGVQEMDVAFEGSATTIGRTNDHAHDSHTTSHGESIASRRATADSRLYGSYYGTDGAQTTGNPYTETSTRTGEEITQHGETVATVYNSETDTVTTSGTDKKTGTESRTETEGGTDKLTSVTEYGGSTAHTGTDTTENSTSSTSTGEHKETTTNTAGKQSDTSTTGMTERNGRHEAPADILLRVVPFIEGTSAWIWFQAQLEHCFLGVYEI